MTAKQWLNDLEEKADAAHASWDKRYADDSPEAYAQLEATMMRHYDAANPAAVKRLVAMVRALGLATGECRMLTNDELQAIRARCEAATPGPWREGSQYDDDVCSGVAAYALCTSDYACVVADVPSSQLCEGDLAFTAHARTDIPALLDHIDHLQRVYTMPCPYCDFSSGQRGMDRCPHCDGTGRMATHMFVAQQRDAALAEVEGLRKEVAHQKRALEWIAEQAAYICSHATGCPVHSQACRRNKQWMNLTRPAPR